MKSLRISMHDSIVNVFAPVMRTINQVDFMYVDNWQRTPGRSVAQLVSRQLSTGLITLENFLVISSRYAR